MSSIFENYEYRRVMMVVEEEYDKHLLDLVTDKLKKILLSQVEQRVTFRNGQEVMYDAFVPSRYHVTRTLFNEFVSYLYTIGCVPGTKTLSFAKINQLSDEKVVSHFVAIPSFMGFEAVGKHGDTVIHEVSIEKPDLFYSFIETMVVYNLLCDENVLMFAFNKLYTEFLDDPEEGDKFANRFMQEYIFGPEKEWATQIQTIHSIKVITNLILRNGVGTPIMAQGRTDYVLKDLSVKHELVLAEDAVVDDLYKVSVHGISIALSIANSIVNKVTGTDPGGKRVSEGTLLLGLANRLDPVFINDAIKKFLFEC